MTIYIIICSMQITASLEVVCISILKSFIFCVDGMLTGMLMYYILDYISHNHAFITCAGHGRKKLHASVRNDSHKAEMYKYLWMLMTEGDPTVFQKNLEAFQTFWERKEPEFISYFKDYYANRVGEHAQRVTIQYSVNFTRFLSYA